MNHNNNSAAIPLEDIFIDATSRKMTIPIPCARYQVFKRDPLEYALGYRRGEIDHLYKTEKAMNITIRQDVCESLFKMHTWGILPSKDQVESVAFFFESNYQAGVQKRVMYTQRFAPQTSYTYRLYFNSEFVQLHLPDGRPCISGETLVTTTLHPCMAVIIARDFLPSNLEEATKTLLRAMDCTLTQPLFLSWFQDNPCLLHNRAETRAIYDCPLRMRNK
ncbi:hypothetical protein CPB85DRAFT_1432193 [Mucidula mucida]|nr:hypothetical protein CPB85DRAFT_1432193 [Mucidula mucida]